MGIAPDEIVDRQPVDGLPVTTLALLDVTPMPAAVVDASLHILAANRPFQHLVGRPAEAVVGTALAAHLTVPGGGAVADAVEARLAAAAERDETPVFGVLADASHRRRVLAKFTTSPVLPGSLRLLHLVEVQGPAGQDAALTATDPVTGLHCREACIAKLGEVLSEVRRNPQKGAHLILIDLLRLQATNHLYSYDGGNACLRTVAERLRRQSGDGAALYRFGPDEFAIVLQGSASYARLKAEHLVRAVVMEPVEVGHHRIKLAVSCGIAAVRPEDDDARAVIQRAEMACALAKDSGPNHVTVYAKALGGDDEATLPRWAGVVRDAIESNRLRIYLQPIVPLAESRPAYSEALVRLPMVDGTLVTPARFLAAAEQFGLMATLDAWVLSEVCRMLRMAREAGQPAPRIGVNLSGASISDGAILEQLLDVATEDEWVRERLCVEVTETVAVKHLPQLAEWAGTLRSLGIEFALDDFGTGMSSLRHIAELPLDYIKIDGAFVRDIDTNPVNRCIVASIQHLGRGLGLRTVAEHVRNDAVLKAAREIGIHYAQGYHLQGPDEFERLFVCRAR